MFDLLIIKMSKSIKNSNTNKSSLSDYSEQTTSGLCDYYKNAGHTYTITQLFLEAMQIVNAHTTLCRAYRRYAFVSRLNSGTMVDRIRVYQKKERSIYLKKVMSLKAMVMSQITGESDSESDSDLDTDLDSDLDSDSQWDEIEADPWNPNYGTYWVSNPQTPGVVSIDQFCAMYPLTLKRVDFEEVFCYNIMNCDSVVFKPKEVVMEPKEEMSGKQKKKNKKKKKKKMKKKLDGEEIFVKMGYETGEIFDFKDVCMGN